MDLSLQPARPAQQTLMQSNHLVLETVEMVNAFGMHAGASVLEVMPVHRRVYPCDKFKHDFAMEPRALHHYTAQSRNASYATSTTRPHAGTYNSDLYLPPAVLEAALQHVIDVGGDPARYRFRTFEY